MDVQMFYDQHLISWFRFKFNIEILFTGIKYGVENCYLSDSAWGAACEYAASYNGLILDELIKLEA